MPKGPKGEKRPADAVGAAVMVAKIATGEIEDELTDDGKNKAVVELGQNQWTAEWSYPAVPKPGFTLPGIDGTTGAGYAPPRHVIAVAGSRAGGRGRPEAHSPIRGGSRSGPIACRHCSTSR